MILLLLATCLISNAQLIIDTIEDEAALGNTVLYYEASGNGSDYGSKDLGKDPESGCSCREYIRRYATCYDIENCKRFPRDIKITLDTFKIGTTAITEIVRGDLRHMHHLQTLLIEANNNLNRLEAGLFLNMSALTNLSISYNPNLLSLEADLFEGLVSLGELLLAKNGFDEVKDFSLALSASVLPRLWKLTVQEMHCPEIGKSDFVNLTDSRLTEVNFMNLQIEFIHPEAFAPFKRLGTLRLGGNIVNESTLIDLMTAVIDLDIPLRNLSLFGLGFRKKIPESLLKAIALSNITWLCLCKNQFDVINDESFPYMPNLEVLDLSDVQVSNITPHAFANLPNLKMLLLNKNKFSGVPEGVILNYLTILDLSENSGVFTSPSYFTLEKNKFKNMTSLQGLYLSHNNLRKIPRESFNGLPHLKVLEMKDSNIFLIENGAFSNLKELMHLDLGKNQFPTRNFNKEIFLGLDKLEVLLMGRCQIKNISSDSDIFGHLSSLKLLDLRGNELKVLPADILAPLRNLRGINLAENQVIVWQERMFRSNKLLEVLLAFDNKIAYLSRAMLEDFAGLKAIDLSKNPFNCECHSLSAFHGQYQRIEKILRLIDERPSYCVYPDEYVNFTIVDYFKTMTTGEICEVGFLEHYIWYVIPAILVTIITAFVVLIYVYRWHIRYWMFLTKLALHRNKQFVKRTSDLRCYTNYEYDAFVSYSNEDRNFVVRLVAMLENHEPCLKLCVYERDFQIGTVISETVLESVSKSRKTLLIISDSYIKSQWCRWEVQVAEHHRLFFENEYGECVNDSIVMVKLGNIAYANLSPMLKYLMKTRIYLQWDPAESKQKVFWEKLRNALAPPKMELSDCNKNV